MIGGNREVRPCMDHDAMTLADVDGGALGVRSAGGAIMARARIARVFEGKRIALLQNEQGLLAAENDTMRALLTILEALRLCGNADGTQA